MNLTTLSGRYYSAATSEPSTEVHPLGAPTNRAKPAAEDPGRWVPAETKGYWRHTKTGATTIPDGIPFHERPWHKPAVLKAEPTCAEVTRDILATAAGVCLESGEFIPASKLADDSATCAVPSVDDFLSAVGAARERGAITEEIRGLMVAKFGAPKFTLIPADRRADVIRALNALGA